MVAIVLAGGASTRFGEEKLAFALGGVPVLRRTFESVHSVDPCVYVCVHRRSQAERLRGLLPSGTPFLTDLRGRGVVGPGAGIVTGLRAHAGEQLLSVAADMPWIEASALRRLRKYAASGGPGVAVPLHPSGVVEPLAQAHGAAPPLELIDRLTEERTRHLRPTDLLRSLRNVRLVPERKLSAGARCFRSLNTLSDLELPRAWRGRSGHDVVRVPRKARDRFWRATDRLARGDAAGAGRGYLAEAEVYREIAVPHLELHCLVDARSALRQAGKDRVSLDQRIRLVRSVLSPTVRFGPSQVRSVRRLTAVARTHRGHGEPP